MGIRIVILSRGRSSTISTHKLLPEWVEVVVPQSQKEAYKAQIPNDIITTPENIIGLGRLRNWCLDAFSENIIIMVDDDITHVYSLTHKKAHNLNRTEVAEIMINAAIMAQDAGCHVFGFNQTDIRKYNGCEPFKLCTWVGGVIGVIGREYRFKDDKFKVDIDFCLQNLLHTRIVWCDNRYYFLQKRDNNLGGNSEFRTAEEFRKSVDSLRAKWGNSIKISDNKNSSQIEIRLNVGRRQAIKYE